MAYIIKDDINHEDWMSCLPEKLWDVPLTHLSIPGEPPRKLSDYKSNCDLKKSCKLAFDFCSQKTFVLN